MEPVIRENSIHGLIEGFDVHGNLISNIDKSLFLSQQNDRKFRICLKIYIIEKFTNNIEDAEDGEFFAKFNKQDKLIVGLKNAKASDVLECEILNSLLIEYV